MLRGPRTEGFDLLREVRGCLPVKLEIELRSAGRGVYKEHGGEKSQAEGRACPGEGWAQLFKELKKHHWLVHPGRGDGATPWRAFCSGLVLIINAREFPDGKRRRGWGISSTAKSTVAVMGHEI